MTLTAALRFNTLLLTATYLMPPTSFAQGPGTLPFSGSYRRPNVSAYQRLSTFANNPQAAGNLYQTLVEPALEQQRMQIEQLSQNRRLGDVQSSVLRLKSTTAPTMQDGTIRATGHSATFLNYSHYYRSGR